MKRERGKRLKTKCLAAVMATALSIVSLLSGETLRVQAAGHTQSEAVSWANAQIGKGLDYDGVYGNQCVDLIKYYYAYFGVAGYAMGNANAYITNSLPAGWTRVYSNYQPGDVAVWKVNHSCSTCSTSDLGHVGIIVSTDSSGFDAVNQNFNNKSYCTKNRFNISALACAIRPNWTTGHNPFGCVDVCESNETGKLNVRGWAIDEDNFDAQLDIHVYIGPENNATGYNIGAANTERPDVDNVYHCGKYHGFDKSLKVDKTGWQRVRIYAINVGGGNNVLMYDNTVYIKSDSEKPVISNIQIYSVNEKGYRVSCDVSDNVGVTSVKFPTWRIGTDPVWYDGVKEFSFQDGERWSFLFDKADIADAKYVTHIYAYDAEGNAGVASCGEVTVMNDTEKPQIQKLEVKEVSKDKIILHVEATDNNILSHFNVLTNVMYSDNAKGILVSDYEADNYNCMCQSNYSGDLELTGYSLSNVPLYIQVGVRDASNNYSDIKAVSTKCIGNEGNYTEINLKLGESVKVSEIKQRFENSITSTSFYLNEDDDAILELADEGTDKATIVAKGLGSEYVYFVSYMSRKVVGAKITVSDDKIPDESKVTPSPTKMPDESKATPSPTKTPDKSKVTPSPTKMPDENKATPRPTIKPDENKVTPSPTIKPETNSSSVSVKKLKKVKNIRVKNLKGRRVKVTWKSVGKGCTYQVQLARNRSFTKAKKNDVTTAKCMRYYGVAKKKTYYFRVRTYRIVDGKKKYGKWSAVKKVKIKK